jgi:hypothetical protein
VLYSLHDLELYHRNEKHVWDIIKFILMSKAGGVDILLRARISMKVVNSIVAQLASTSSKGEPTRICCGCVRPTDGSCYNNICEDCKMKELKKLKESQSN